VLPKLFSTATKFRKTINCEPHSFTGQKKSSSKKKQIFLFIIEYNFTKELDLFLMRRVIGALVSVTVDGSIDVHVSASYVPFYPFLILLCALFFTLL
jgi:hypothetical protein